MGYTKREFLKILGLGLVFMPLASCFSAADDKKKAEDKPSGKSEGNSDSKDAVKASEADVLVLKRDDAAYEKFNQGFNKRLHFLPKYIAICKTEKGVQYAIEKAKEEKLKIAVKSGGHSFEGFSNNNGGMVINMSQMKKITWLDNNEVEVQPGCLLQDIQAAFFPKQRLLPSGSCGTVGIAGLTLGGGYGFFSRKFGFTCDSLQELKLVTADAKVVSTNDDKELLWACKGGGNGNFGVVTSFRFRTYEMPPTFDSYVLKFRNMNVDRFAQTVNAWFDISEKLPQEGFAAYVLNGSTLTVLITSYKSYPDFGQNISALTSLADSVSPVLQADLPKAMKRYYGRKGPINFKNASAGLYKDRNDVLNIKDDLFNKVIQNKGIVFQINTLGGKIADSGFEENSCYPHRHLSYLGELQAYWDDDSAANRLINAFEEIQTLFANNHVTAHYRNYPDINFKNWEHAYYGDNYARLQKVKSKYDADNVFEYPQSIKPG
jgi:FAD/FMN-containing dehydrogenase